MFELWNRIMDFEAKEINEIIYFNKKCLNCGIGIKILRK